MIREQYITFETAKLLKDKGLGLDDLECEHMYDSNGCIDGDFTTKCYPAVTQQVATKWLRDEYGIFIELFIPSHDEHEDTIYHDSFGFDIFNTKTKGYMYCGIDIEYDTYEEAVESAIQYCLTKLV